MYLIAIYTKFDLFKLPMHLFIQVRNKENLFFHTSNDNDFTITYNILIQKTDIQSMYIDADNTIYAFGNNTLYKVSETIIPLYFDVKCIHFGKNIHFIANEFIIEKITDSNYKTCRRVANNAEGILEYNGDFVLWNNSKIYFPDNAIEFNQNIKFLRVYKNEIYLLSKNNHFYIYKKDAFSEIINLNTANIIDLCFNDYLPVVAFLTESNIFILDIDNQKIVKVIESYTAKSIKFKNKRELYIMGTEKVIQYHLGKDLVTVVLEHDGCSQFFYFELNKKLKFDSDHFKEEIRSKLIENKIENKRMIYQLMNEIEELKMKIVENNNNSDM